MTVSGNLAVEVRVEMERPAQRQESIMGNWVLKGCS